MKSKEAKGKGRARKKEGKKDACSQKKKKKQDKKKIRAACNKRYS